MKKKEKILILRGGQGIGDLLFTTPIPRLLAAEGYSVDVAVWPANQAVYAFNPYVKNLIYYPEPDQYLEWKEKLEKDYKRIVYLGDTLEVKYLHRTDGLFGPIPSLEERRAAAVGQNYINETVRTAGFDIPPGKFYRPELYLSGEETKIIDRYREELALSGKKIVFWNLNGSTKNKCVVRGFHYLREVLAQVPNSVHWIVDGFESEFANMPQDPRVKHSSWDLRTSLLLTQLADVVIGPESALVNAAGAYDTPKVIFYSHSAPENLGIGYRNHYPICPSCDCHPCYLLTLDWSEVWNHNARTMARNQDLACRFKTKTDPYRTVGYHCTCTLPDEQIIDTIVKILT
jgi:hypothetical protein